ncbi:protein FAR-RED IMPAIRED RESPONSE 1-like [Aegilops tauschii subsp. strangulata]|uniref:protein FAR-RED IMPAIRED RESPONSE 1-like n=1 Tax=Aegilops tauschii subsp. strangulata TaxID=200361 RepID=UPI001ABC1394|nr:protein FAR-RED IMPAIRED RESPONSE 1-like [Aegilops tauschii subsp. strangulata]
MSDEGNEVGGDDDNEDMDLDDSYAESGSHMEVEGYYEWNFFDDANDQNDIDASYNDSSSKGEAGGACENDDDADGDECNFDTGYDEYQQESLDRHWTVMSTTFRTDEEAYDFYNVYAKKRGFSIRKDNLKYAKGIDARRRLRRFLCSRAGKQQAKFCTMEGKKRRLRAETRCCCEAHLTGKLDRERSIWEKMKLLAKGDADTVIGIMMTRKARDPDFFFEHTVDAEGNLKNMFWCDSQSRRDYLDFGDVVVFNSTYKMNRYGMPFIHFVGLNNHRCTTVFGCAVVSDDTEDTYVTVLQTFLRAHCQKKLRFVITDGDAAMIRAVRKVLTDVWHRLCSWHIKKNMQKHLHHKSLKEFRSLIYYATTHDEFEASWAAFRAKWESEKTETWLRRMNRKKRLWAASYLTGGLFLGMRSNQRSETLNSCLHMQLDSGMTIVDMVVHYENCIVRLHENESYHDCMSTQTLPVPVLDDFKCIEKAAARHFTAVNFYLL